MVVEFKYGKLIVTQHEIVVRIDGEHKATLQAAVDAIQLVSGANVIVANSSDVKWSIKLDNEEQLKQVSDSSGCAII